MSRSTNFRLTILLVVVLALAGCSNAIQRGNRLVMEGEWIKAIRVFREALKEDPTNPELNIRLRQTELDAVDYFYSEGRKLSEKGDLDKAVSLYQQGLTIMPKNERLALEMGSALAQREASALYSEALRLREAGNLPMAFQNLERALDAYPKHKQAAVELAQINEQRESAAPLGLVLSSRAPIKLKFRETQLRSAFEFIAKSFGANVVFDEGVSSAPVTLFVEGATFEQALNLLLTTTKTFFKKIGPNTILIAPDTLEKRGQYEDQMVRTFQLNSIKAKDMIGILKGVVTPKKVAVNDRLNTLIVRDTSDVLKLTERLILLNDRKPAELLIEVEIIEVNRTKAERLGFDFGSEISAQFEQFPVTSSFREAFKQGTVTLPGVIFRYFKQDVEAKTLANPKLRVVHGKEATIHIGDRVPLRSSTIQDASGQTRTTFVYTDIGIRLQIEAVVHLDNSVTVKLGLEVSTLGQNLGTPAEPAFAIGTRNAKTTMLLRDGETAVLGGLIRDEERSSTVRVPGLGDIPILGIFFRSSEDSSGRTDVMLTITPRILRPWNLPSRSQLNFYSGNTSRYSNRPLFAGIRSADSPKSQKIEIGTASKVGKPPKSAPPSGAKAVTRPPSPPVIRGVNPQPLFTFSKPVYQSSPDQEFEVELVGENLKNTSKLAVEILFKSDLLDYIGSEQGPQHVKAFNSNIDKSRGVLRLDMGLDESSVPDEGKTVLAKVRLRGKNPGVSYFLYRAPQVTSTVGAPVDAQIRASRIVIK